MPFSVRDFASEDPFNYRRGVPLRNPAPAASGAVRALTEAPGSLATLGASRRASAEERVGPGRAGPGRAGRCVAAWAPARAERRCAGKMSGGLAPSKSTVYVSNLPFALTNNDLYRIFSKYGKVVKVTIMKDKDTRKSKGVAFILFLDKESAQNCSRALNNKQLFGRVIKASIAIDNGRAAEFIRRRNYFDKSKCYECGEAGHLSYACPKNMLGEREPPKKKEKKKRKKVVEPEEIEEEEESEEEGEDPALDSLSQAIAVQQAKIEEEQQRWTQTAGESSVSDDSKRPRIKKSAYFSDEEELSD